MKQQDRESGVVLYDVIVGGLILGIAVMGAVAVIPGVNSLEHSLTAREKAYEYLQSLWEETYALSPSQVVARFNTDTADDPDGVGTAPGPKFQIEGFQAVRADGCVGHIVLPPLLAGNYREDAVDEAMGMPRDLDGDGIINPSGVPAANLKILPLRITVEWTGAGGPQRIEAVMIVGAH